MSNSIPVKIAKEAVNFYIKDGRIIDIPDYVSEELKSQKAGAFVCLKIDCDLRGCIGTIEPVHECLASEIIANAIGAAVGDPRFLPVGEKELDLLEFSVDVLTPAERISGIEELDPTKYGVIVESGSRRGLLLPDLDGVDNAEYQIDIARKKANILPGQPITLYRFEVIRYH